MSPNTLHSCIKSNCERKQRGQAMRSKPICAYVYINGEIIQSSSANTIFRGDKTKSLLLNPIMTLLNIIITAIQSSITNNGVTPIISALWYRCPVYEFNGEVQYRAIQIIDEEDVLCMFHTFLNMTSVICMELKLMFIIHYHLLKLMT